MQATRRLLLAAALCASSLASAQVTNWTAFNDHNQSLQPVAGTHPNATVYSLRVGPGGALKDVATGEFLAAQLLVVATGGDGPDDFGGAAEANPGTPAYNLFNGFVDTGGVDGQPDDGIAGVRNSEQNVITFVFTNLNPTQRYFFRGTSVRGNNYNDRWSLHRIRGATFVDAHVDGSLNTNIFTGTTYPPSGLGAGDVALNSGENRQGSLVGWDQIDPGADGGFTIDNLQYVGPATFGNPSAGPYGYGLSSVMLLEVGVPTPVTIVSNPPANVAMSEGRPLTLSVLAQGSPAPTYQWYKDNQAIPGAAARIFSIPSAQTGDSGDYYAVASNPANSATSMVSRVVVSTDTNGPVVLNVRADESFQKIIVTWDEGVIEGPAIEAGNYYITDSLNSQVFVSTVVYNTNSVILNVPTLTPSE